MARTHLNPPDLPTPIGPFSYGVVDDGTVYVSGAVGTDENWKIVGKGDVAAQTQRAFENIEKVLKTAGCSFEDVIKMNMYLVNAADYKPMNEVRKRVFRPPYPASTVVVVKELVLPDLLVEVEVIAKRRA
jgi:2-iminobutanoate/2-iminopropanoate deaminase